jgi:hypothetical protein
MTGSLAAAAGLAALIVILAAPWPIAFAIAASGAATWCVWLERHPHV